MKHNYHKLAIRPETNEQLELCKLEYIRHHPEFEHIFLSADKILHEVTKYYLNT